MGAVLRAQDQSLHHKHRIELNSSVVLALCVAVRESRGHRDRLKGIVQTSSSCNFIAVIIFFQTVNRIMQNMHPCIFALETIFTPYDQAVQFVVCIYTMICTILLGQISLN